MIADVTVRHRAVAAHHLPDVAVVTTLLVGMTGMIEIMTGISGIMNAVIATMTAGTVIMIVMIVTTIAVTVNVSDRGVQTIGNVTSKMTEIAVMMKGKGVMMSGEVVQMEKTGKVGLWIMDTMYLSLTCLVPLDPLSSAHDELDTAE